MTSRRVEDAHTKAVDRILSASGMVCIRSQPPSELPSFETEPEEYVSTEIEEESLSIVSIQEDIVTEVSVEAAEEEKAIFPSPSLRRVLSDKARNIELQNTIHVLPKEFKTKIDPAQIPKIHPTVKYIDILAGLVGCSEYKRSLAEFWFLDTMANLLRRAQEELLPKSSQAVLMLWFCEWMKEVQNFDAADRPRLLRRFKENMLSASRFIAKDPRLPTPDEAGVYYQALEENNEKNEKNKYAMPDDARRVVAFQGCEYECAMRDLVKIMHYIYDIFSSDYQFDLIRSIFTFTPEYNLIELPFTIQNPKRYYTPYKPKKEKPKKESKKDSKAKFKKRDSVTPEFIALMELKTREEHQLEEEEAKAAENWNLRNSILPLAFAATDELFEKYWPPPEPEPEPVVETPAPTGKGKKKK